MDPEQRFPLFHNCSSCEVEDDWMDGSYHYPDSYRLSSNLSDMIQKCQEDIQIQEEATSGALFRFIVLAVGISVVAILGIIGNGLSAVVLSRPQMKSSVSCLLLGLTFCDTLLISISIFAYSLQHMHTHIKTPFLIKYHYYYYPILVPYLYASSITAQTASVYLTVAVTLERYIAVCHSLRARSICTWRRARICVASVLSFSILYNLPRWFEVVTKVDPCVKLVKNVTVYMNEMSELRQNEYYIKIYIMWAYFFIMYLIPFTGLVVFNFAIYRQVRKANRERAQLSKLQKREMGLASMLLIVVVVFLMCNVLPLVHNVFELMGIDNDRFDWLMALSNFLVIFNSSINFVIYCTCGERFRRLLFRLCRDAFYCRKGARRGSNGFYRKSNFYRSRGDFEEMSLASMANNHTCLTTAGGLNCNANSTLVLDMRELGHKGGAGRGRSSHTHPSHPYRERNKTIPVLHGHGQGHLHNGKANGERRISTPNPGPL